MTELDIASIGSSIACVLNEAYHRQKSDPKLAEIAIAEVVDAARRLVEADGVPKYVQSSVEAALIPHLDERERAGRFAVALGELSARYGIAVDGTAPLSPLSRSAGVHYSISSEGFYGITLSSAIGT